MSNEQVDTSAGELDNPMLASLPVDDAVARLRLLAASEASEEVVDALFAQVFAYQNRGLARDVLALLDRRREIMADDVLEPVALGWLLNERGTALSAVGDHDEASAAYHDMAESGRRLGDDNLVATAEQNLGNQAHLLGDRADARLHYSEAARRMLASGDTYAAIQVLINVTALDIDEGHLEEGERALVDLRRLLRRAGAPHLSMTLHGNLALLAAKRRDFKTAERHARRSLHYARRSGDETGEVRGLHTIGNIRLDSGDARSALRWYRRALKEAEQLSLPPLRLLAHQGMAAALLRIARYREAVTHLLAEREIARGLGDREHAAHALADCGAALLGAARVGEATDILQDALREIRLLSDTDWERRVLANLAEAARQSGNHDTAGEFIEEALLAIPEGQAMMRADLLRQAAHSRLDAAATFEQGVEYLRQALAIEEREVDDNAERAWAYSQTAAQLAQRGERRSIDASVPFYDQALRFYEASGEEAMAFHIRNDRAIALTALGRYGEAQAEYRRCLATAERRDDRVMALQAIGNLGESLSQAGAEADALPLLTRALSLARALGDQRGEANALGSLGLALGKLGDWVAAEDRLSEALALGRAKSLPIAEAVALGGLALVAFERADYHLAQEYFAAAAAIEESLQDYRHLVESLGGLVESLAALGETEAITAPAQRFVDLAQAIGAEDLASDSFARAGRWYLRRADVDQAAELYAVSLAAAATLQGAAQDDRGVWALSRAATLPAMHAKEERVADLDSLYLRIATCLDEQHEGLGSALDSLLAAAREQFAAHGHQSIAEEHPSELV